MSTRPEPAPRRYRRTIVDRTRISAGGGQLQAYVWNAGAGGRPFLFVHGLASNALLWAGVADHLATVGHPVVAIDLRGHGRSWKPDDGYDMDTVAADVIDAIAAFELDRPVVVGQSWGANVALQVAVRSSDLIAGIGLVDGGWIQLRQRFATWEECKHALSPPALAGTPAAAMETWIRERSAGWPETAIAGALGCFEVLDDGTVRPWLTLDRHLKILEGLWAHDPPALYPEVASPVLLVPADDGSPWAAEKKPAIAEAERLLPRARTQWFAAHHDVHAQFPDQVAALLHGCTVDGFFT